MDPDVRLARSFMETHPDSAAMALEQMSGEDATALLSSVPVETAARVIIRLTPYLEVKCLNSVPPELAGALLKVMPRDHSALILRRMKREDCKRLLAAAPADVSTALTLLLRFPENTAGALMDPDVLALPTDIGVGEALEVLRSSGVRISYYIYVIDRDRKLAGVVNLRELLGAPGTKRLGEVMQRQVSRLSVHADFIAMRAHPGWLEYYALPVVDDRGMLMGILRYRTLRAAGQDGMRSSADGPGSLTAGLALGELYWSTMGQLLHTIWPASTPSRKGKSEEPDGR